MNAPSDVLCRVALSILSGIDTPTSAELSGMITQKRWRDIAEMRVSPSSYSCAMDYRKDVCAVSLLRKLPMPTGIDTAQAAFATWTACERQCYITNKKISALSTANDYPLEEDLKDLHLQAQLRVLRCARKWVSRIVGKVPTVIQGRPSKRATCELRRADSLIINKFAKNPALTPNLCAALEHIDFMDTAWARSLSGELFLEGPVQANNPPMNLVKGNRFSTVPKDGSTDRPIACEPTLNVYAQLGVGDVLKRRLRRFGLLATRATCGFESQVWHRQLAQKASLTGELATIDLSSASDTVAYGVVQSLMPNDWFALLNKLRSPFTAISHGCQKGSWHLEKFSSMGNGFTFEVETVIFAALAATALELKGIEPRFPHNLSVYGDDIIVPVEASDLLLNCLNLFGFSPNMKKTFTTGPFRESCGGDFWEGEDVRPIFITEDPQGPLGWYSLHNKIVRLSDAFEVSEALQLCRAQLPTRLRFNYGPPELGDAVLQGGTKDDYTMKMVRSDKPSEPSGYWVVRALVPVVPSLDRVRWDEVTGLVATLYGVGDRVPLWEPGAGPIGPAYRTAWIPWG